MGWSIGCPRPLRQPNPSHFCHSCRNSTLTLSFTPTEALLGFSPNLGQASSKLSLSSLLRSALGAAAPVGLRVKARY